MFHHIMEDQQCSPLSWSYYYQEEGVEELKQSLLYSTLELEAAVVSAHEEISRKDDEIAQLKGLLSKIIEERDVFRVKCQELILEKQLFLQQMQVQPHSSKKQSECPISSNTTTSNQDDNIDLSPSDCDDNINNVVVPASPGCNDTQSLPSPPPASQQSSVANVIDKIMPKKSMPEKGKFLQAVMEAGPLLQTLLLAGPLPQWQHPPPQLNSIDIPPVTISSPKMKILHQDIVSPNGGFTGKRALENRESLDLSPNLKYQKVCSPNIINSNI